MKILFAGTPEFAVPSLVEICRQHEIIGVLTQADAATGRGKKPSFSSVKIKSLELSLPVFQPEGLDESFHSIVKDLSPDLLVCAAYGKIFKKAFLDLFPMGGLNVHPSLLPRWRGPSPITAAILAGDKTTGVTIQRLALKMDSGNILAQKEYPLDNTETAASLSDVLAGIGAKLLVQAIDCLERGSPDEKPQNEADATCCRLVTKEDGLISWQESAPEISRMIRAYAPWPRVHTWWRGKRLFFLSGGVYPLQSGSGSALTGTVLGMDKDYGILIHTSNGILFLAELQLEFKKALPWREFLNGNREFIGSVCGGTK